MTHMHLINEQLCLNYFIMLCTIGLCVADVTTSIILVQSCDLDIRTTLCKIAEKHFWNAFAILGQVRAANAMFLEMFQKYLKGLLISSRQGKDYFFLDMDMATAVLSLVTFFLRRRRRRQEMLYHQNQALNHTDII